MMIKQQAETEVFPLVTNHFSHVIVQVVLKTAARVLFLSHRENVKHFLNLSRASRLSQWSLLEEKKKKIVIMGSNEQAVAERH